MTWYTQFTHWFGSWLTNLDNLMWALVTAFFAWVLSLLCPVYYPLIVAFDSVLPEDFWSGHGLEVLAGFTSYVVCLHQFYDLNVLSACMTVYMLVWVSVTIFNLILKLVPGT